MMPGSGSFGRRARALRLFGLLLGLIAVFTVVLTLVFAIPSHWVRPNVIASIPRLKAEGVYPRPFIDHAAFQLDNTTDSLMLDVALGDPAATPFVAAMAMTRGVIAPEATQGDPIRLLEDSSTGQRSYPEAYARYWHGYQVVLRPALVLFDYQELRYLNLLSLGLLVSTLGVLMWTRAGPAATTALIAALLLSGFVIVPMSLQYSGMTYVGLLATLAVVLRADGVVRRREELEWFLIIGACAAFVDLLTIPLLTLGLPLGVALALRARLAPHDKPSTDLRFAMRVVMAWLLGYAGAWGAKLLIGSLVLGPDVVAGAAEQARLWTGVADTASSIGLALKVNLMNLLPLIEFDPSLSGIARYIMVGPSGLLAFAVFVGVAVILGFFHKPKSEVARASVVLLLVPMPYVWLSVLNVHSNLHYAFTYRVQAIAVFAVVYFIVSAVDWGRFRSALAAFGLK